MSSALYYPNSLGNLVSNLAVDEEIPMAEFQEPKIKTLWHAVRNTRVLLAEDDPDTNALLSHMLENIGIEVIGVEDGDLCVEHALVANSQGSPFDIILMDLQMPRLDGYSAAGILRLKGYNGAIIAMTARPIPEDFSEYQRAGCNYYLTKGQIHQELPSLISHCIFH